jgi:hypothetical protein
VIGQLFQDAAQGLRDLFAGAITPDVAANPGIVTRNITKGINLFINPGLMAGTYPMKVTVIVLQWDITSLTWLTVTDIIHGEFPDNHTTVKFSGKGTYDTTQAYAMLVQDPTGTIIYDSTPFWNPLAFPILGYIAGSVGRTLSWTTGLAFNIGTGYVLITLADGLSIFLTAPANTPLPYTVKLQTFQQDAQTGEYTILKDTLSVTYEPKSNSTKLVTSTTPYDLVGCYSLVITKPDGTQQTIYFWDPSMYVETSWAAAWASGIRLQVQP